MCVYPDIGGMQNFNLSPNLLTTKKCLSTILILSSFKIAEKRGGVLVGEMLKFHIMSRHTY